jgi:hypothetical protein
MVLVMLANDISIDRVGLTEAAADVFAWPCDAIRCIGAVHDRRSACVDAPMVGCHAGAGDQPGRAASCRPSPWRSRPARLSQ